jgi:hypothetical protein
MLIPPRPADPYLCWLCLIGNLNVRGGNRLTSNVESYIPTPVLSRGGNPKPGPGIEEKRIGSLGFLLIS